MANQRVFTLSEISQHKSNKDCWLVINGRVVDVTKILEEHPGGEEVIIEAGGKDATKEFDAIGHSKAAQNLVLKYQVGVLEGATVENVDDKGKDVIVEDNKEPKNKEMSAFVIKEDSTSKITAFIEFFVPILFACIYFGYRVITSEDTVDY